jgi:integrase
MPRESLQRKGFPGVDLLLGHVWASIYGYGATRKGCDSMARRGFGSIRKRPSGRYQVRYKGPDGTYHTAPMTYPTKRDAEAYLRTIEADVIRQSWRAPVLATEPLGDYGRRIIAQRPLRPQSRAGYLADWENHVEPFIGAKRVGSITPPDVRAWHADLSEALAARMAEVEWVSTGGRRDGSAAVARSYRILRMVLNQAVGDGLLAANPCQISGAGTYKKPKRPTLSPTEVEELAGAVPTRYRALVLVLAWAGLRLGEATELRWRDVDLETLTLNVERAVYPIDGEYVIGEPKSDAGRRRVSIPASLAVELDEHGPDIRDPDALVFTTRSNRCAYSAAQTAITRTLRSLGRTDVRVHDLRHTGHTLAAMSGATLADLMERLGHSTVNASMTYAHSAGDQGRAVAKKLEERRAEVVELNSRRASGS